MKKRVFLSCLILFAMTAVAHAFYYENSMPHNITNGIDCVDCHGAPDWASPVSPLPSLLKSDCTTCHINDTGANFTKTNAPLAQTHHGDCWDCHQNHFPRPIDPALVDGSYNTTTYDSLADTTTFALSNYFVNDTDWNDPATWSAKTGAERGLVHWVRYQDGTDGSFEVVDAFIDSITVNGALLGATDSTFDLLYGQMVADTIAGRAINFTGPRTFADNDALAGDIDLDGIADDSTPNGVCQVCHTQSRYWRADGTRGGHFSGADCMVCHEHVSGFAPSGAGGSCDSCHGFPPVVNTLGGPDGLVSYPYPTGSTIVGFHELHSATTEYNLGCGTCHFQGMPATAISGNDLIQMGFDAYGFAGTGSTYDGAPLAAPYGYEATNGTVVTTNGSLTCSNVYCHSDGTAVSTAAVTANTSPAWDGSTIDSDGNKCNNCHAYPPAYFNFQPKANNHVRHQQIGYTCDNCHYGTTTNGLSITDKTKHVNGSYDVQPGPTFFAGGLNHQLNFTYTYGVGGGTCSSNTCHQYWGYSDSVRWGRGALAATASVQQGAGCGEVIVSINVSAGNPGEPTPPFSCYYEWGDGTIQDWSEDCSASHTYAVAPATYAVTWSVRDANLLELDGVGETIFKTTQVTADCPPPPAVDPTVMATVDPADGHTVTLTVTAGNPALQNILVDWRDGRRDRFDGIVDPGTAKTFIHNYVNTGSYVIKVTARDTDFVTTYFDVPVTTYNP